MNEATLITPESSVQELDALLQGLIGGAMKHAVEDNFKAGRKSVDELARKCEEMGDALDTVVSTQENHTKALEKAQKAASIAVELAAAAASERVKVIAFAGAVLDIRTDIAALSASTEQIQTVIDATADQQARMARWLMMTVAFNGLALVIAILALIVSVTGR